MGKLTLADLDEIEAALRGMRAAVFDALRARLGAAGEAQSIALASCLAADDSRVGVMLSDGQSALLHRELDELHAIDEALKRIEFGVGGLCTACGSQIALARLRAMPAAATCAACATRAG